MHIIGQIKNGDTIWLTEIVKSAYFFDHHEKR